MARPRGGRTRRWPYALFLLFLVGYNLFRIGLFVMAQNGTIQPEHALSPLVNAVLVYSEFAIGAVGLLAIPGLLGPRRWGATVTVGVSLYAIAFDAWAAFAVQMSAVGGVIPPAAILLLLLIYRRSFFPGEPRPVRVAVSEA